jgi:hypothetical protein
MMMRSRDAQILSSVPDKHDIFHVSPQRYVRTWRKHLCCCSDTKSQRLRFAINKGALSQESQVPRRRVRRLSIWRGVYSRFFRRRSMDKQRLRMYRGLYISELVNEGHKLERASRASRGPAVYEQEIFRRGQGRLALLGPNNPRRC